MTTRDFTANVISASKVVPDGNFKDSKASGVWDINEALDLIKGGNWPNAANFPPESFVDGLFQTHLYDGNGGTQTITNNINLSGKGGLVWTKRRDSNTNGDHTLYDTERGTGTGGRLRSNNNQQAYSPTDAVTAFNNNGFSIGADASINTNSAEYVSWTFRKQPKFFDIVTYTGNGTAGRTISHNLGSVPGFIIVKRLNGSDNWTCYHRGVDSTAPENYILYLNDTAARSDQDLWADTAPTSSVFSVGDNVKVNGSSSNTYVAYLFAHNNSDGGFGPDSEDIIKCGSYTGNAGNPQVIDVGFEPQFLMVKAASTSGDWFVVDNMRGVLPNGDYPCNNLYWNKADAETLAGSFGFFANGFTAAQSSNTNGNGVKFIYMAIRRGGMSTPTVASSVFAATDMSSSTLANTGFAVDLSIDSQRTSSSSNFVNDRLRGSGVYMNTDGTTAEQTGGSRHFDSNQGVIYTSAFTGINWSWKRARGYFDMVAYTGTGSNQTLNHNLGVKPELMIRKKRNAADSWEVAANITSSGYDLLYLNTTGGATAVTWPNNGLLSAEPTSTSFQALASSHTFINYLFATVAGVSKVGSFTGNGGDVTVDCGFTNGCKFVLYKATGSSGQHWRVFDSVRGINDGNDPAISLNLTSAELTTSDLIDPTTSGFTAISTIGEEYIFYAIANDPS